MRTEPATRKPDLIEPDLLATVAAAGRLLVGEKIENIVTCDLNGVAHTWGGCPHSPVLDGIIPRAGATLQERSIHEILTMEQCQACASLLRPGGDMAAWLLRQLDPLRAAGENIRRGDAIRRCRPTVLLGPGAIAKLLDTVACGGRPAPGPLYIIDRTAHPPAETSEALEEGFHSPEGLSLVGDSDGTIARIGRGRTWMRYIGNGEEEEIRPEVARICLRLAEESSSTEKLWSVAVALLRP